MVFAEWNIQLAAEHTLLEVGKSHMYYRHSTSMDYTFQLIFGVAFTVTYWLVSILSGYVNGYKIFKISAGHNNLFLKKTDR